MTKEQASNLGLGFTTIDDRTILTIESAIEWINRNTSLNISQNDLDNLSAGVKSFIIKYDEIMNLPVGITSESLGGMSQSFESNKSDLLLQYASDYLGDVLMSQMSFVCAKQRW